MGDKDKTREQLITELAGLRQRIVELEASATECKQAEEALRESEERYRSFIQNLNGIAYRGNVDFEPEFFHGAVEKITGYTEQDFMEGKIQWDSIIHKDDLPGCLEKVKERILHKPRVAEGEFRIVHRDGSIRWIHEIFQTIFDDSGEVIGSQGIQHDITEHKQAEEALRESEERYRALVESSHEVVFGKDRNGRYHTLNLNAAIGLGGTCVEDVEGKTDYDLLPKEQADALQKTDKRIMESGKPMEVEEVVRDAQGKNRIYLSFKWPTYDNKGRIAGISCFATDITERKRMEDELREGEERYHALISLGGKVGETIIMLQDTEQGDAIHTFVSDEWSRITGYSSKELLGMSFFDLLRPKDRQASRKRHRRKMSGEIIPGLFEMSIIRKGGTEVPVEVTSAYTTYRGERANVAFIRDITERKRAEVEKSELERKAQLTSRLASVGEMAAGIAHEINNPLTGVIGFARLLMQKNIPDDLKEPVKIINDGAKRVADIVSRLLTFARRHEPERGCVDINEIIETTLDLRAYEMETANIKVTTRLVPDLPRTVADGSQLQQVFLNIIINAESEMQLAHGRGNLLIKTETTDSTIRVSFKDDGPGIAKKNLDKIFDPFFTTREVGGGTGLGLSLCHGIIAEHNGHIYARSQLGRGATFVVELPVVIEDKQLELPESTAGGTERVAGARILVVDDEPAILQLLEGVLTDEGHEVETADSADGALAKIKSEQYNLILLDIKLPGMSGIELYKRIQRIAGSLASRVIFITGDVIGTDTRGFLSRTRAHYITKPLDIEQLKREISSQLCQGA